MPEVIHPGRVIKEFSSRIMKKDGFWVDEKSLLKHMGVIRKNGNWLNSISEELLSKGLEITSITDNEKEKLLVFTPSSLGVIETETEIEGSNGIERAISFITKKIEEFNSSFYITDILTRKIMSDGYFTEQKRLQIDLYISSLGYKAVRQVLDRNLSGGVSSWNLQICKIPRKTEYTLDAMENQIRSLDLLEKMKDAKPDRMHHSNLSVNSIDWNELENMKIEKSAPYYMSIIDSSDNLTIDKQDIELSEKSIDLIRSNSIKRAGDVNISGNEKKVEQFHYDAIGFWQQSFIGDFNNNDMSFYIPFHIKSNSPEYNLDWGIYISLEHLFSSAISLSNDCDESKTIGSFSSTDLKKQKHLSLYWNLYLLSQRNYFKYQIESLATWFEIILHQSGSDTPVYKEYHNAINSLNEDPNIEDLAAEHYSKSSLSHFSNNDNEVNDARLYKEIVSSGNYFSYKKIGQTNDKIPPEKKHH